MIGRSTLIWAAVLLPAGAALFHVKYAVQDLEAQIGETNHRIVNEQEAIHILKAEWSYLNDPARIQKLVEYYNDQLGGLSSGADDLRWGDMLREKEQAARRIARQASTPVTAPAVPPPAAPPISPPAATLTGRQAAEPYSGAGTAAHVRDLVGGRWAQTGGAQ